MFGRKKAAEDEGGSARGLLKGKLLVDRLKRESRPPAPGNSASHPYSRESSPAPTRPQGPAPPSSQEREKGGREGRRGGSRGGPPARAWTSTLALVPARALPQ